MIKLVTLTRISPEKGIDRMLEMERVLPFQFEWDLYTDLNTDYAKRRIKEFKKIKYKGFCKNPLDILKNYSYLVQVSDMEGYSYSIVEALKMQVPVIITDFPVSKEIVTDNSQGYIVPMDLNFDWNKLKNIPKPKKFKELSNENDWLEIL